LDLSNKVINKLDEESLAKDRTLGSFMSDIM